MDATAMPAPLGRPADMAEVSRLRSEVAVLGNERDMREKLELLLEVQSVQVNLQKELRVKMETLLQVEQQVTSKLRQQLDSLQAAADIKALDLVGRQELEERFAEAQERIRLLEKQLAEAASPETAEQLRLRVEEQERIIQRLNEQMDDKLQAGSDKPAEGDVVRLQLLLASRDKHSDELEQNLRKAQNESAEYQSEADVLRHQVRVMKKQVAEKTEKMERQLSCERNSRAEILVLHAKVEQLDQRHQEEARRASELALSVADSDERQRHISRLEQKLDEEQTTSTRERERLAAECEYRTQAKEQTVKNQTTTIASLTTELKEKQAEIDNLVRLVGSDDLLPEEATRDAKTGVTLPRLVPASPSDADLQVQRSLESLHRQVKAKDAKIAKQTDRLQTLKEMLERRDQQLEELASARRDRETLRNKLTELEEVLKAQPRVATHAEAERRLIEQEQRLGT